MNIGTGPHSWQPRTFSTKLELQGRCQRRSAKSMLAADSLEGKQLGSCVGRPVQLVSSMQNSRINSKRTVK